MSTVSLSSSCNRPLVKHSVTGLATACRFSIDDREDFLDGTAVGPADDHPVICSATGFMNTTKPAASVEMTPSAIAFSVTLSRSFSRASCDSTRLTLVMSVSVPSTRAGLAIGIPGDRLAAAEDPDPVAVAVPLAIFELVVATFAVSCGARFPDALAVVGVDARQPRFVRQADLLVGPMPRMSFHMRE